MTPSKLAFKIVSNCDIFYVHFGLICICSIDVIFFYFLSIFLHLVALDCVPGFKSYLDFSNNSRVTSGLFPFAFVGNDGGSLVCG